MQKMNLEQHKVVTGEWQKIRIGGTRAISYDDKYKLYKRVRTLNQITNSGEKEINSSDTPCQQHKSNKDKNIAQNGKNSKFTNNQKGPKTDGFKKICGNPRCYNEPKDVNISFDDFDSLKLLRSDTDSLIIAVSTMFDSDLDSNPLCYCFSAFYGGWVFEYCFVKNDFNDNSLILFNMCIGRVLDDLCVNHVRYEDAVIYKYIPSLNSRTGKPEVCCTNSFSDARDYGIYSFLKGKATNVIYEDGLCDSAGVEYKQYVRCYDYKNHPRLNVTIIGFDTLLFLSSVDRLSLCGYDFSSVLALASGLFSTHDINISVKSVYGSCAWNYCYLLSVSIRDCKCFVPADFNDVLSLHNILNVPLVSVPERYVSNMRSLYYDDMDLFLNCSSIRSLLPLIYSSNIFGFNKYQSHTLMSISAWLMRKLICETLNISNDKDFDHVYRGWIRKKRGKSFDGDNLKYRDKLSIEAVNRDAFVVQNDLCEAYRGGVNSSYKIGFFDNVTYDFDLKNAYAVSMCAVPDVDWDNCILEEFEQDHILTLDDFCDDDGNIDVFAPILGYVSFVFPDDIVFPTIAIYDDDNLIFSKSSEGLDGVYALGPDLYVSLRLGAKIVVHNGYKIRTLKDSNDDVSYSLRTCTKQLVSDRAKARLRFGKNSIAELLLKLLVNGCYGKIAQNIVPKRHWSAATDEVEDSNFSVISNPFAAAMTTSIIRSTLLCTLNEVHKRGFSVYSCTTDGFISDISLDELSQLDLFGIKDRLSIIRAYLTDNESMDIWEVKHIQNDLLNFTTRGNVSLNTGFSSLQNSDLPGVCAHAGVISSYKKDSYADRLWLATCVLSRVGSIEYVSPERTTFKKFVRGSKLRKEDKIKPIRLDFDMKRKPIKDSFKTVFREIDGVIYEIENFDTEPFESIQELRKYKDTKLNTKCLRTKADWDIFWRKISVNQPNVKVRDLDWAKLNSVIMGHRAGKWSIEILDSEKLTVAQKCDWINKFNKSKHTFKISDWKNARKPERQVSILEHELLEPLLTEMQAASNVDMQDLT